MLTRLLKLWYGCFGMLVKDARLARLLLDQFFCQLEEMVLTVLSNVYFTRFRHVVSRVWPFLCVLL